MQTQGGILRQREFWKRLTSHAAVITGKENAISCWCCKNKNRKELKAIYQFLPEYWEKLKELQAQIPMPMKPFSRKGIPYGNVFDLEKVFEQEVREERSAVPPKKKRRCCEQSR
ncbi:hypothetical protein [uncultured Oscillibacter sp.]|uniref:hypothetical protein n=1 Tax=uncultured Oscillibacter sp. TaxID=876091 RepID=UPI0026030E5B|nr:hypothetical protein [uncultured Oscillibacter sp.]